MYETASRWTRVGMVLALPSLVFPGLPSRPAAGHEHAAHAPQHEVIGAAQQLIEVLPPEKRAQLMLPFDSSERHNWHFVPKERLGLTLKAMSPSEREAAEALLRSVLSANGMAKAQEIMALESVLRTLEAGREGVEQMRDPEKYAFLIFGTPGATAPWGWRFEGHHLSLNFSSVNGLIVSTTPLFVGANPSRIPHGPRAGHRVLGREEDVARQLARSLTPTQWGVACIQTQAPPDVLTVPGQPIDLGQPAGLAQSAMDAAQRNLLWQLISNMAHFLRGELAAGVLREIETAGRESIHFAWAGSLEPSQGHYYRLHGPTFIIEYDNTQNQANHVHIVWHSLRNDFGLDTLQKHYDTNHRAPSRSP